MAEITGKSVMALRQKTGAGMMDCKAALTEAEGNEEKAIEILRKKGMATADKKADRIAAEGAVGSYIHMGGKVGVMVEINCESDFVARGEEFQQLVKDVAMHIAAVDPKYTRREEVPSEILEKEREILLEQLKNDPKNANKPEDVINKIIEGRLNKFYEENVLVDQPFVKDPVVDGRRSGQRKSCFDQRKNHDSPFYALQNGRRNREKTRRFRRRSSFDGRLN